MLVKAKEELLLKKLNKIKEENHHSQRNLEEIRRRIKYYINTYEVNKLKHSRLNILI